LIARRPASGYESYETGASAFSMIFVQRGNVSEPAKILPRRDLVLAGVALARSEESRAVGRLYALILQKILGFSYHGFNKCRSEDAT